MRQVNTEVKHENASWLGMVEESSIDNTKHDSKTDLTGRDCLVSNVLFSWVAHLVFIIVGFIMPRMIDQKLGQELLGVWDFGWSLVSYFGLVQMGVGSSVNRYVAKYRASGNIIGVNRIVSAAFLIQGVSGMVVIVLTIALSLALSQLFGARLKENVGDAQWVVLFLGASVGIQMSFAAFGGVLTGCHRWELHNLIKSGWHAFTFAGMIVALMCRGGLPSLGIVTLTGYVLDSATRVILAHRICRGLRLQMSLIEWPTVKNLFVFGGKTLIPSVSNLLLSQTINVLIVAYLGPAALALYARPRSLISHISTLVNKMAMTLTPTASSLQSAGDRKGIEELLIKSVRYSFYIVLPMILVLAVFGGPVLLFWMGTRYENGLIPAILAVGYLAAMVHMPVWSILAGLNAHGRAGVAQFVASLGSVGLTVLALGSLRWGLAGAALAATLPLTIANIIYLPYLVCRQTGLALGRYYMSVFAGPSFHVLPFLTCLLVARFMFIHEPLKGLACGFLLGSAILACIYWKYVLPERIRSGVINLRARWKDRLCDASGDSRLRNDDT